MLTVELLPGIEEICMVGSESLPVMSTIRQAPRTPALFMTNNVTAIPQPFEY